MLTNAVVISVLVLMGLSLARLNVVLALVCAALTAGLFSGLSLHDTLTLFTEGLGGGAPIALSYALLGAFAVGIARSGVTEWLAARLIRRLGGTPDPGQLRRLRNLIILVLLGAAVISQNLIPVHIAFIPILVPPLLGVMARLRLDRRLAACVLTFGLITPYMVLPVGFGSLFLYKQLEPSLAQAGLDLAKEQIPRAMLLPAGGMLTGLLLALWWFRKPRNYQPVTLPGEEDQARLSPRTLVVAALALGSAVSLQLLTDSIVLGALIGFLLFTAGGVVPWRESQDAFTQGVKMMSLIGFIMIAANGYAAVVKGSGQVPLLVEAVTSQLNSPGVAAAGLLLLGLFITLGIGSSFSTIPIIATLYVPLCLALGFSPLATAALVGSAAALGDAGSPASDSTLGPTAGLNADGQHDHIRDTVIPTFVFYNLPLLVAGWIAAMVS
ncbi:Na+/H+ antiporter family protein [Alloalcanivorax xenomutans]|jgi:putative amino acid transporter|uniref:Na+/H+ antiporter family protein n=1 Tax=Alloalcanivorax xenomutans TaxID=1094342 RepID=UPI0003B87BFE|nr:Na+/H+ antiporter NhaC family protein [Alloalcanivorax xenomutans]ERS15460.1 sodium:proton antiporter [Alcanivorax sp. PN-3]KYZ86893.1 sodium:proton antiporter [Alcanivorax sp. KX64203]MBA4721234.1 sodium:proton antiporter [Alcanivorax sp.]PHS67554.1 MAG: sodium:proton antiporter [Alcanivorax sp.]CUR46162.1 Histidine permease YuiF [Alloalcanivorax xenomutans]